ncbi:MAG: hypothetical protein SFW67_37390 [Myxococcaceae bacterium]|nr:hypothetical protein [Myxococcaceae bacterium]
MMLPVLASLLVGAAPVVGVAVGKRSGTSVKVALERAELVRKTLGSSLAVAPAQDFSECDGKRPCLVRRARALGLNFLVELQAATVVGDPLTSVLLWSIDDDGKVLKQVLIDARPTELEAATAKALVALVEELDAQLKPPPSAPPPAPPTEPPLTEAPPPSPPPTVVAPPVEPVVRSPVARWLPVVAGAVVTVGGGVLFGLSRVAADDLRNKNFASEDDINRTVEFGLWAEPAGLVAMGVGAVGTALALVFGLAPAEAPVTLVPGPSGGFIVWSGAWP